MIEPRKPNQTSRCEVMAPTREDDQIKLIREEREWASKCGPVTVTKVTVTNKHENER